MTTIDALYRQVRQTPSDIHEHLDRLRQLGESCDHITEFGVRTGVSTIAWAAARPKVLVCYDISRRSELDAIERAAKDVDVAFSFHEKDVLATDIEPTDLLFIDTLHTYDQLQAELAKHASQVRKYLVLHDTETFAQSGELEGSRGLWPAIEEFLAAHPEWTLRERRSNNNGLTVLAREGVQDDEDDEDEDKEETPMIYVVSLAKATARRARMIERLSSEDLPYTIVDACESTDPAVRDRAPGDRPDGELRVVACLVSHLRALQQFLATPAQEAIICEDDSRPRCEFARHFAALRDNIPDAAPLVSLGYLVWHWDGFVWSGRDTSKENLTTIGADLWGTQMYLVRRSWAAECLARFGVAVDDIETDQIRTAELITRESRFRGGLAAYPPLAIEDLTGSILNPAAGVANHPEAVNRWDSSLYVP